MSDMTLKEEEFHSSPQYTFFILRKIFCLVLKLSYDFLSKKFQCCDSLLRVRIIGHLNLQAHLNNDGSLIQEKMY